jgi:Na+/glutamate symporter
MLMEIIRDLLVFMAAMFAMCIVLIVVVSNLPDQNPLKRILTALSYRVGATLLAGAVAVPVEPIPGLDVLYDLAVPIALIWYWFTFFRGALQSSTAPRSAPPDQRRVSAH